MSRAAIWFREVRNGTVRRRRLPLKQSPTSFTLTVNWPSRLIV
jgi:hypothetical protein